MREMSVRTPANRKYSGLSKFGSDMVSHPILVQMARL